MFLLQADLFGVHFKNLIPNLFNDSYLQQNASDLEDYTEMSNNWYIDIGYKIWFAWLLLAFSPHLIMPLYHYGKEWINEKWARE